MGFRVQIEAVKSIFIPRKGHPSIVFMAWAMACAHLIGCASHSDPQESPSFEADRLRMSQRMVEQEMAWNAGDLEGFMDAYWRSDSLRFVGSRGPSRGWQTTLDNYRKGFATPEEMGQLTFGIQNIEPAGPDHALMLGSWQLNRSGGLDTLAGWFSLVWQRRDGDWVIVRDHSS